jgi:glycosyltransferase involved in cell wall biosynthesis
MRKILSIVIPMYNSKEFIAKCLDSFLIKNDMECVEIIYLCEVLTLKI